MKVNIYIIFLLFLFLFKFLNYLRMFCIYFQNIENLMKIVQNVLTYV